MDKVVLIVATGRSGSTTLKNVINLSPGVNICGETTGAIIKLLEFLIMLNGLYRGKNRRYNNNPLGEFCTTFDYDKVKEDMRVLIRDMFTSAENTIWGFKEIDFCDRVYLIDYFLELFPNTKIILSYADDIESQAKSLLHARKKNGLEYLKKYNDQIIMYEVNNMYRCKFFTFKKHDINNIERYRELYTFLEIGDSFDVEKVSKMLTDAAELYKKQPYIFSDTTYEEINKQPISAPTETNDDTEGVLNIREKQLLQELAHIKLKRELLENEEQLAKAEV